MEVFKFTIIPTEEYEKREQFRHVMSKCSECRNALEFSYQQDEQFAVLQEDSHCPNCAHQPESTRHRVN